MKSACTKIFIIIFILLPFYHAWSDECAEVKNSITIYSKYDDKIKILDQAYLIRPSVDSQNEALAKISKKQKGSIVVVNDKITHVVQSCDLSLFSSLDNVSYHNLNGRFIIPGLQDSHVHNFGMNVDMNYTPLFINGQPNPNHPDFPGQLAMAYRMAYAGITSHMDLTSYTNETMKLRDNQRERWVTKNKTTEIPYSHVYMSGGIFALEGGHHGNLGWLVGTDKHIRVEIKKSVAQIKPSPRRKKILQEIVKKNFDTFNPDLLKISYDHNPHRPNNPKIISFDRQLLIELIDVAFAINPNVKVICHIGIWQDLIDCMDAGAHAVTHIPYSSDNDPAYQTPKGIYKKMKDKGLAVITTQSAYMELAFIKDKLFDTTITRINCKPGDSHCKCIALTCTKTVETGTPTASSHFFEDSFFKSLTPPSLRQGYFDFSLYAGNKWAKWEQDHNNMGYRHQTLRSLLTHGVQVLAGTDSMWESTFFGFSLHRELELMWLASQVATPPLRQISQMEVLRTATTNTHTLLNHWRGRLVPGFKADLVVLKNNPLEDIRNTRLITEIMLGGELFQPKEITPIMMGL